MCTQGGRGVMDDRCPQPVVESNSRIKQFRSATLKGLEPCRYTPSALNRNRPHFPTLLWTPTSSGRRPEVNAASTSVERFYLDDGCAVIVAGPERHRRRGVVDEHTADVGVSRQQI